MRHSIDPDFRPNTPLDKKPCCICGKATNGLIKTLLSEDCFELVTKDEPDHYDAFIGPDCAKKVPSEFIT